MKTLYPCDANSLPSRYRQEQWDHERNVKVHDGARRGARCRRVSLYLLEPRTFTCFRCTANEAWCSPTAENGA